MSDRIRVLCAIGSLAAGGSERQLLNVLQHLDRSRFRPHLYLLDRGGEFLGAVPDDVQVTAFSDVAAAGLYFPGRIRRAQIRHLQTVLREQAIDVIYERTLLMPLVTGPAARREGVPRISTIVSDPVRDLQSNVSRFRTLKSWLLRKAYHQAAAVIAVSEGIRTAAIQHYQLMSEQVHTIHNGFDFERIQALAAEPAPELKLHEFSVLGIGRLQREKGFDILLDALKRIRERRQADGIRVWLIGAGPEESTLRNLAAENGLAGQVEFVGFQTNPYRWMRHAQLVCLPSRFEGMPNVLVEAMACGVPVVASDCPHGPREILNSGSLGCLVETGDSAALAEAILECRNHYDAAIGRAAVARESVAARFSMQNCISEIQTQLERAARQESS